VLPGGLAAVARSDARSDARSVGDGAGSWLGGVGLVVVEVGAVFFARPAAGAFRTDRGAGGALLVGAHRVSLQVVEPEQEPGERVAAELVDANAPVGGIGAGLHEPGRAEGAQVLAHGGLGDAGRLGELSHRLRLFGE